MRRLNLRHSRIESPLGVGFWRIGGARPGPIRELKYFVEENVREAIELQDERLDGPNPGEEKRLRYRAVPIWS
jgi:hypothetical protein